MRSRFELYPAEPLLRVWIWKSEGELLILEGRNKKDTEVTKIKFNKTTGKVVSVNLGGKIVPTEKLDLLKVKKS